MSMNHNSGSTGNSSPDDARFDTVGVGRGNVYEDMQYATQRVTIAAQETRRETLNGEEYLVAPVTAVREMVLKGELLPFQEIQRTEQAWNGKLLTLTHPKHNGRPEPASNPKNFEKYGIGWLFGVNAVDRSLKADAWMNLEASAEVADALGEPDPVEKVENGDDLEVSVGYWFDRYDEAGEFRGTEYAAKQGNIRPDHLATLPSAVGECSVKDGCGITANEETVHMVNEGEIDEEILRYYEAGVQARSSPRTPEWSGGLETQDSVAWGDVDLSLGAFIDAYADENSDASGWEDLNSQERSRISARTLHGDPDGDSVEDGIVLPVVRPETDALHEGGLDAALQRAPQTGGGINAEEAQAKCRSLLEEHFDRDFSEEAQQLLSRLRSVLPSLGGSDRGETHEKESENCKCQHDGESSMQINQTEGDAVRWESDAGTSREPSDVRYGVIVQPLEDDAEDVVYVAPYQANEDYDGWEPIEGDPIRMNVDNLEVVGSDGVGSLPPVSQVMDVPSNQEKSTMSNYDYERLSEESAFDEDELRENDDLAAKVSQTLEAQDEENSDDSGSQDDDGSSQGDDEPLDPDEDDDSDLVDQVSSIADSVQSIDDNVNSLSDRVEQLEESHEAVQSKVAAQEESDREELKSKILTHSSLSEDQLPESTEKLEALSEELKPRGGWVGGVSSTANQEAGEDIPLGLNEAKRSRGD